MGGIDAELKRCADLLSARDLATAQQRDALRAQARVPDDYDTWKRVVGLYWFTRIPFASGVRNYQTQVQAVFQQPVQDLRVRGSSCCLRACRRGDVRRRRNWRRSWCARGATRSAIPEPDAADPERLFAAFAPVWVVDERDDNDRIGALVLGEDGRARVDTVSTRRLPAARPHPLSGPGAAAAGLQRVAAGASQDFDVWTCSADTSTESSGASRSVRTARRWSTTASTTAAAITSSSPRPVRSCCRLRTHSTSRPSCRSACPRSPVGSRIEVRLETGTHYIQRVLVGTGTKGSATPSPRTTTLRSLPHPAGGRRSAFRADGIVPGSERGERYLFWPMGVREPGAMRQWGRHATAFIGRRHFDEARLIERYFILRLD